MELFPLKHGYFTSKPSLEKKLRQVWLFAVLLITLILILFWYPLRDPESTYALVSITITNPAVLYFFRAVTILGSEGFFLVLFSTIYWSVSKTLGSWGLIIMAVSIFLTSEIPKDLIRLPRPDIRGVTVPTYTFPSGHTSGAVSVWGSMAIIIRKRWFWFSALTVMILVGLSRVMLGYHFPGDVLGGLVTGSIFIALLFGLAWKTGDFKYEKNMPFYFLMLLSFCGPLVLSFIPATYAPNLMGYAAGAGTGFLLDKKYLNFSPGGTWWHHPARFAIGVSGIALTTLGAAPLLGQGINFLTFVFFALATFWATYLAPLLFIKMGLAARSK